MTRMIDGVVAVVPSYCYTVISFYMFIVLEAKKISCYYENYEWGALPCFLFLAVVLQRIYSKTTRWQSQINDKDIPRSTYCYLLVFLEYIVSLYTLYSRDSIYSDVCMCASVCMYRYVHVSSKNEGKLTVAAFVDAIHDSRFITEYSVCYSCYISV